MRGLVKGLCIGLLTISLVGCHSGSTKNTVRIGTIAGEETVLMEEAKKVAHDKYDTNIEIIQFTDYALPNRALADGNIDANMFQHQPYLDAELKAHQYKLKVIGKTFIYPMAIYAQKIKSLAELPDGAIIAVPNDPSNEARALLLLQKANLITLKHDAGNLATIKDIAANPKNLVIKELDAANLVRALPDVSAAVINTNFALFGGLTPEKDGLLIEDKDSPYANLIVVREGEENDPKLQTVVKALHDPQVIKKAEEIFHGGAVPAW